MSKTAPLSHGLQVRVRSIAQRNGDVKAAEILGVGRATIARAAAGLAVRPSVAEVIAMRIEALDEKSKP